MRSVFLSVFLSLFSFATVAAAGPVSSVSIVNVGGFPIVIGALTESATVEWAEPDPGFGGGGGGGSGGSNVVPTPEIEWEKRQNSDERLTVFGDDLFGDQIDPHTGSLVFEHTDVSLPGNFALPVSLIRRRESGFLHHESVQAEFGDWEYVVPRIETLALRNGWTGSRCSTSFNSKFQPKAVGGIPNISYIYGHEYSNGVFVDAPGHTRSELLFAPQGNQWPASATHVTTTNWYFTCGSASDGGQGFIGRAPNGDTYRFDRVIVNRADDLGNAGGGDVQRDRYVIAATQVTDVNGNWVRYDYDSLGRLTRIHASDGRSISLTYSGSSKLVSTVNANGRIWRYYYRRSNYNWPTWKHPLMARINSQILDRVQLPDGKSWELDIDWMSAEPSPAQDCQKWTFNLTMRHPYGATGRFRIKDIEHRYIYAAQLRRNSQCPDFEPTPPGGGLAGPIYQLTNATTTPVMSVTRKEISGHYLPGMVWTYEYEQDTGSGTSSSDRTNWTRVFGPGIHILYKHKWTAEPEGGAQVSMQVRNSSSSPVLETTTTSYLSEGVVGTALQNLATPGAGNRIRPRRTASVSINRNGDVYTTANTYNTNFWASTYSYGYPTQVVRGSNLGGGNRTLVTTYRNDKTRWVIGRPLTETFQGRLYHRYYYDSLGRVTRYDKYGSRWGSYAYHTATGQRGALRTHTNAEGNVATFNSYKRGRPQSIIRYDGTTVSQVIDNNGWITSQTNARGHTTAYQYNAVGWRTRVNRPGSWADTTISYVNVGASSMYQRLRRGRFEEVVWYDAMLRPWRSRTLSTEGDTPRAHVRYAYDGLGRQSFESFPSTSGNPTAGTYTTHDALGRQTLVRNSVTDARTTTQYLSNGRSIVTDPLLNTTTTYRVGFGSPDDSQTTRIDEPLGLRIDMTYDTYGNMATLRQSGTHNSVSRNVLRQFWYDGRNRVCRHRAPEVGDELYTYDVMDRQHYKASGLSTGSGCATPPSNVRSATMYDAMNRVISVDYPAPTFDITKQYDADGNLKVAFRTNGTTLSYNYDSLDNITYESVVVDQRLDATRYTYSPEGYLKTTTFDPINNFGAIPNTGLATIDMNPNGLGQPRSMRYGGTTYLSNASYHVGGELTALALSNGFDYSASINNRLLKSRMTVDNASGTKAVDYSYGYDAKLDRVSSILDYVNRSRDRSFGYDAQGRLVSATSSSWGGTGTYSYDVLDNLLEKRLGSRTVNLIYNSQNRLHQMRDTAVSGSYRTYGYDSRGNVTYDARGEQSFAYDLANQPTSVSGSTSGSNLYDARYKRVKSTVGGKTRYFHYSTVAGNVTRIAQTAPSVKTTTYVRFGQVTVQFEGTQLKGFIHTDHQGSSVAFTTPAGAVQWREAYTPFGEEILDPSANNNSVGYTAHLMDDDTGLVYMQARHYDPVVGRFLSTDPVDYADQLNLYAYVNNNPMNKTDPTGEIGVFGLIVGAIVGAGTEIITQTIRDGKVTDFGKVVIEGAKGAVLGGLGAPGVSNGFAKATAVATAFGAAEGAAEEASSNPDATRGSIVAEGALGGMTSVIEQVGGEFAGLAGKAAGTSPSIGEPAGEMLGAVVEAAYGEAQEAGLNAVESYGDSLWKEEE